VLLFLRPKQRRFIYSIKKDAARISCSFSAGVKLAIILIIFMALSVRLSGVAEGIDESHENSSSLVVLNIDNIYREDSRQISLTVVRQPERVLPDVLKRIRQCESRGDYQAQNPRSTASGAYQFIDSTWNNFRGYPKARMAPDYIQDEYALLIYQRYGTRPWAASQHCWGSKTPQRSNSTVSWGVYYKEKNPYATDCVQYLRYGLGIELPRGAYARRIPIRTKEPQRGRVIVTLEGRHGHFGYVTAVQDGLVYIQDGNYIHGYMTLRTLPVDSPLIRGYL
jgi:hypothetical protein